MSDILFYILAGVLILFSALAVSLPNLLHGAIALIASFFATAALYIMLQLEFVALSQIMLYIGGIIVFMLIIILLTTGLGEENRYQARSYRRITGMTTSVLLLGSLLYFLLSQNNSSVVVENTTPSGPVTMDDIGYRLLSNSRDGFVVPFEVISVLLLVALVGAVVIARRDNGKEKAQ